MTTTPIQAPTGRHGLMHTHLPLFLTTGGGLRADSAFARSMADYLTRIVMVATRRAAGKRPGKVACESHAVVGRCRGVIETSMEAKPRRLEWWCPVCGYDGSITGWEETQWDRSKPVKRRKPIAPKTEMRKTAA